MSSNSPEAREPHELAAQALDLLNEALTLLDAAMAHQPAALTDLAINMLGGWTAQYPADARCVSILLH